MKAKTSRLDRFINKHTSYSLSDTRLLIAQKRIFVDGKVAEAANQKVGEFTQVVFDGQCLNDNTPVYLKLYKPKGVVSATTDKVCKTALDLINHPSKQSLHITGRLDKNTTGLLLLTNDGAWSRKVSLPETKLPKTYELRTAKPITPEYVNTFKKGVYFGYEDIITQPATLELLGETTARLTITEGKYHQIKRMFGVFRNEVLDLHRVSVGGIGLGNLKEGESCLLSASEISAVGGAL